MQQRWHNCIVQRVKAWRVHEYGPATHSLRIDQLAEPLPRSGQLRIRVSAAALNVNDADMCRGEYPSLNPPLPFALGMEVAGVVDAADAGHKAWVGKRVMAITDLCQGGYAEKAVASIDNVFEAPGQLDDAEAAGFLMAFHIAHLALFRRGRLKRGETVLVHSAAGGVGSAAVQLAVSAGARVFTTSGGPQKAEFCRSLGAEGSFDNRTGSFVDSIFSATDGHGVDVVFDLVGGATAIESLMCLAREGRYLIVGFSGDQESGDTAIAPRAIAKLNIDLIGVAGSWADESFRRQSGVNLFPRAVGEAVQVDLVRRLDAKLIRPTIGKVVSFDEIPHALEELKERRTIGKTVAIVSKDAN
jgi:NADPH2:quinone reductase